jgi:hypothetical protein
MKFFQKEILPNLLPNLTNTLQMIFNFFKELNIFSSKLYYYDMKEGYTALIPVFACSRMYINRIGHFSHIMEYDYKDNGQKTAFGSDYYAYLQNKHNYMEEISSLQKNYSITLIMNIISLINIPYIRKSHYVLFNFELEIYHLSNGQLNSRGNSKKGLIYMKTK